MSGISPISFMSLEAQRPLMGLRATAPIEPVKKVEAKKQEPEEKLTTEEYKKAFRGADALANYNKAFFVTNPIKSKPNIEIENKTPAFSNNVAQKSNKAVEKETPAFKAEEGIENLEAQKKKFNL